ncbi:MULTISPECIES: hypothetical protein [Pectobacterium]|uniref:Uncharacterized protein n=1 Tax=Pectobacterium punjabense TaxID=2108399 RepID=A0ABX6L2W8_9GAMM|nr:MULTISPECIES: hypothetical protein [Pectobacterium]MBS4431816.1 hypothetical protein [Pectobacterium punjabense]MCE9730217.1 hypothetical protein [Pectobacterium sp. IFB5596]PTA66013.1 hypothetical protein C9I36_00210 [Pectobacterium punjabense]QJA20629.1 hypothetical protein E2566_12125 [Pectobacterium punjabense]
MMPEDKTQYRFTDVLNALMALRGQAVSRLSQGDTSALQSKLQLDDAIQCLQFCQRHQITASASVIQLPATRTTTPSSEYRIIEDHETERREYWTELDVNNHPVRPSPGVLLLDCGLIPKDM